MGGGAWWAVVHGVAGSRTRLSNFTFTFHSHALEKEMATHSSVVAWRIPGTGEPGGLPSVGSHRVWHDWSDLTAAAAGSRGRLVSVIRWKWCESGGSFIRSSMIIAERKHAVGNVLAGKPRLPSMGSHRVGHDWSDLAAACPFLQ